MANESPAADFAPGHLIVHFKDGIVSPPHDSDTHTPTAPIAFESMVFENGAHRDLLQRAGVEAFEMLAPYWWNIESREYRDLHGEVITGLVDFTNVYVLHLASQADIPATEASQGQIAAADLAHYVAFDVFLGLQGCSTTPFATNDEHYDKQWGLHNAGTFPDDPPTMTAVADVDVNYPEAMEIQPYSSKKIAIIDTGLRATHVDLSTNYDYVLDISFAGNNDPNDHNGHGTQCAGIVGSVTNSPFPEGIASPRGVGGNASTLVNVKISNSTNWLPSNFVSCLAYASSNLIPVVSMSLGVCLEADEAPLFPSVWLMRDAVKNAFLHGLLPVAAAGNGGVCAEDPEVYPAAFEAFSLGVGHIRADGTRKADYNAGYWVDVVAPGGDPGYIVTTCRSSDSAYTDGADCPYFGGTSASTPLAAGLAGLLWTFEPDLTNEDVAQVLMRTARPYGSPSPNHEWGAGLIRADAAIEYVGCDNTFQKLFFGGYDRMDSLETRWQDF